MPAYIVEPPKTLLVLDQVDVVVAGGGTAGVAAQVGATARQVPIRTVQKALLAQDVYLGESERLAELGLA